MNPRALVAPAGDVRGGGLGRGDVGQPARAAALRLAIVLGYEPWLSSSSGEPELINQTGSTTGEFEFAQVHKWVALHRHYLDHQ